MNEKAKIAAEYIRAGLAIIPLKPNSKAPATKHGLNDWSVDTEGATEYFSDNPTANIGIVCGQPSHGVVVIDLDDHNGANGLESLKQWETGNGKLPETVTALTGSGGRHLLYKCHSGVQPSVNKALGVDIRGNGSYIVAPPSIHPNGEAYVWLISLDDMDIADANDTVYAFIDYVQRSATTNPKAEVKRFELPDVIAKGERDNTLYKYACSLRARNMSATEITTMLEHVNVTKVKPPLEPYAIQRIVKSASSKPAGHSAEFDSKHAEPVHFSGKFTHNKFARYLIQERHCCIVEGIPAIWDKDHYATGQDAIIKVMIDELDAIKDNQRKETIKYILAKAPKLNMADDRYICFKNGVLDLETMEMQEPTPELVICNVVPHNYIEMRANDLICEVMEEWANGDDEILTNLWEIIGLCLYRGRNLADCPILVGNGANGKSTYLNFLHELLGYENISTLDISTIGERFQSSALIGKLANIGDDISNEFIGGAKMSVVKKAITMDWISAEYKGGAIFSFRPYATQIFSCNEMPRLGDNTDGVYRRLRPVPFNGRFDRKSSNRNSNLGKDLAREEVIEGAISMGIIYLKNLLLNGGMSASEQSELVLASVKRENSTVLQWLHDEYQVGTEAEISLDGEIISELYGQYADYCKASNLRQVSRNRFGVVLNRDTEYVSKIERRNFADGSKAVTVLKTA